MRVMLTGAGGFVAPHVLTVARDLVGSSVDWLLTSRRNGDLSTGQKSVCLDVTDEAAVTAAVRDFAPTHVLHLAGVTSISAASSDIRKAWEINLFGSLNIARALAVHASGSTLISVGTGLSYGASALHGRPLTEDDVLNPQNDYAVTKTAADVALGALADRSIRILRLRPFNHTGPGQSETFVLPSFAAQVARIEKDLQEPVMRVGNLDVSRDFLDVSDVARAYAECIIKAEAIPSGTVLNIASGVPRTIRSMLDIMLAESSRDIEVEIDPARVRSNEIVSFVGNADRARALLGWAPRIDFSDTIRAMLKEARQVQN